MRELKIHLYKDDTYRAVCGKYTKLHGTTDPELISCKTCSGIYRTNMEWYSQVRNKHLVAKSETGEGDIYTRQDVEAGLRRLGYGEAAIRVFLHESKLFRNVFLVAESPQAEGWS